LIVGTDEVGYGAIAGSLFVVGVAMPQGWCMDGVRDSKQMSAGARHQVFPKLIDVVRGQWALCTATAEDINKEGVFQALLRCHRAVIQDLTQRFSVSSVVVDGSLDLGVEGVSSVPKADGRFPTVSAASVIAKVLRDEEMELWARRFPAYGFEKHKGYGTPLHLTKIRQHGLCPIHRTYPKVLKLVPGSKSPLSF